MPSYTVQHAYAARKDGVPLGPWTAGDSVELSGEDAAWVERDSPGIFDVPPAEPRERAKPTTPNRQAKPGPNRGKP